jgi:RimJ/RimL family protein N-acetyltransferase
MDTLKMVSGNIRLRSLSMDDIPVLTQLANNKKIWVNLRDIFPHPYTEEDARIFIRRCMGENPKLTFAIEYQNSLTGVIGLVLQSDVYRFSAEIGYWIGEPYWNKGIATRAVNSLVDYGFQSLHLQRIFTGVFDHNKASQRVLEKCGFTLEGIASKAIFKNNRFLDEYKYALTRK